MVTIVPCIYGDICHYKRMTRTELIQEIERHAKRKKIAPATVTSRAVGNSRLYDRMVRGGDCTTEIAGRVIAFIQADLAESNAKGAA